MEMSVESSRCREVNPSRSVGLQAGEKSRNRNLQRGGNPHQRIDGDVLFAALHLADVIRVQVGFLSEFFLREPGILARRTNGVTDGLAMFGAGWHATNRNIGTRFRPQSIACFLVALLSAGPWSPPRNGSETENPNPERNHMKSRHLLAVIAAAFGALIILSTRVHANAIAYTVTDLGTLWGSTSNGYGINASGQIAGDVNVEDAVRWTGTTAEDLGGPGVGFGINDSGQVVGWRSAGTGFHAMRWTGTTAEDLGTLGTRGSRGNGINAFGQVAGMSWIGTSDDRHAVRWTGTTPTDLGTLGGRLSFAYGINDSGQVAGWANNTQGKQHAVRWTGTTPTDLGTLNGSESEGYDINVSGQVAGDFLNTSGNYHAVRWTGTTGVDLGTLPGYANSHGYGINQSGDVVGLCSTGAPYSYGAFLYTGNALYDLNNILVPGSGVTGITIGIGGPGHCINDSGQIAATGTINGQQHALRLDPVATPEPSSILLLASTGLLAGFRRFKRTSRQPQLFRP